MAPHCERDARRLPPRTGGPLSARVLVVRGHQATPWELRPWELISGRFDISYLRTRSNRFGLEGVGLEAVNARALRDFLPRGRIGDLAGIALGDRYFGIDDALAAADIVHAEELSYWFAAEVARRKGRHRYRLVLTVWETLPLLDAFRNRHARVFRRQTLPAADLFLAATERAREALLLEGASPDRIEVCPPGIDVERFRVGSQTESPGEHLIVSPGRLVWEKGHQDVLRALAVLRRDGLAPRLLLVGSGPEEGRLREHAAELGIADAVEFRSVPYEEMPALYGRASCLVLASLSGAGCSLFVGDPPRCFWEEQFGMVLAEAMAAGLPIVASTSGAIPEVAGASGTFFAPGDWRGLARVLADGPLSRPPGERVEHDPELVDRYSAAAAAERLASAYDRVLGASAAS